MGKYANLEADIFSVFNSGTWKATNIQTVPANFTAENLGKEYIRVNIIPSGTGVNLKSVSGVLIIDIFIAAGQGPKRTGLIADILDGFLVGKERRTSSGGSTQLLGSSLSDEGNDKANPTLHRSSYTIPFNYFGVL
jgi:hypothetical protein